MILLSDDLHAFPLVREASSNQDIIAIGGDLHPQRLLLAYSLGIFPWYNEGETPILWQSPNPRFILLPEQLRVNRSLRRTLNKEPFEIRFDTAFELVLERCAQAPRAGQLGTWLNPSLRAALTKLHHCGYAHSAEAWLGDRLVGGLYGLTLGGVFFGESMFAEERDASKVTFVHTVRALQQIGYSVIDCQAYTDYLAQFGAVEIHRDRFINMLSNLLKIQPSQVWPD
jgi:leucyl/phenylalanyl-tRNA--protein transferase